MNVAGPSASQFSVSIDAMARGQNITVMIPAATPSEMIARRNSAADSRARATVSASADSATAAVSASGPGIARTS